MNQRRGEGGAETTTSRATIQRAVQALSVRYSSDFRKNDGQRLSSNADQSATRCE